MLLLGFSRDSILFFNIFILSQQSFVCRDRSFFGSLKICLSRSVILSILCCDNLMCGYWNSYVATSTIVSRQCFCLASSNWCRYIIFYVAIACLFGSCCNNFSCIVSISIATRKVCRNRLLLPLNLISYCSFILILRHSLLVLLMFAVVTQFLCRDRIFCIQLIFVSRPSLLCRDKTSPCVGIFVTT